MTQGDPLSMFYSNATLPLVWALKGNGCWFQSWYADDSVCAGSLDDIRCWLDRLLELGPSYGYFPEPRKGYLVVALNITHLASDAFTGLGISVVCSHSILGGVIGEATQCEDLIRLKVNGWVHSINALAKAARKSPQEVSAFAAMAKSLQFKWSHVQKVVRSCGPMLQQLHITNFFQPYLILVFLSWRLPCFFYQLGWGDLAFVTQLISVMLILTLPMME